MVNTVNPARLSCSVNRSIVDLLNTYAIIKRVNNISIKEQQHYLNAIKNCTDSGIDAVLLMEEACEIHNGGYVITEVTSNINNNVILTFELP